MTAKDLDDTLKTIAANAKAMRDAGVIGRVVANGVEFELDRPDPPKMATKQAIAEPEPDPINDPDTFGADSIPRRRKPFSKDAARAEFEKE